MVHNNEQTKFLLFHVYFKKIFLSYLYWKSPSLRSLYPHLISFRLPCRWELRDRYSLDQYLKWIFSIVFLRSKYQKFDDVRLLNALYGRRMGFWCALFAMEIFQEYKRLKYELVLLESYLWDLQKSTGKIRLLHKLNHMNKTFQFVFITLRFQEINKFVDQ